MVQGNIPQSIKWDPAFLDTSFNVYLDQTEQAARHHVDLAIWPEAAAVFFFQPTALYPPRFAGDAVYRERLLKLAAETGEAILFGAPALGLTPDGGVGTYNRAYLVSGAGKVVAYYDKMQLVPFGEYLPMRPLLGKLVSRIVHGFGDMIAGTEQTLFPLKGAQLGVLICYESVFPDLTRRAVKRGADVLVNITNDAWYGESSAPYQLLAMTAMRAVETKVPIVRVANTGISAVIDADGSITARTPLFKRGTEIEDVSWRPRRTVYTVVGDLFSEICFVLMLVGVLLAVLRGREAQTPTSPSLGRSIATATVDSGAASTVVSGSLSCELVSARMWMLGATPTRRVTKNGTQPNARPASRLRKPHRKAREASLTSLASKPATKNC